MSTARDFISLAESNHPSKKVLFKALDEFFKTNEYSTKGLKAKGVSSETFGKESMIYVTVPKEDRRKLEDFLSDKGFKVSKSYSPGQGVVEVRVSYFKGWHWDE